MIQVEFRIKKEEISPKSIKDIMDSPFIVITITCFLMPTRFLIDGVDIFYHKKYPKFGPWHEMPIVDWATSFLYEIQTLPKIKKNEHRFLHEGYHEIIMEMQKNNKVKLTYMETKKVFIVDYDELLNAFLKFEKEVKKFLNDYVPQFKEHSYWGSWIRGETKWINGKGLVQIKK